jgi:hypothetical protein
MGRGHAHDKGLRLAKRPSLSDPEHPFPGRQSGKCVFLSLLLAVLCPLRRGGTLAELW